jgi:dephospho-CoA kinase
MSCRLRIGLTGGIGSGKSEASRRFHELGVPVIDTDVIARELVEAGQPALNEIIAVFGSDILDTSDQLDRSELRKRVFADTGQRQRLEAILHPRIRESAMIQADRLDAPYCVLVIPLLLESARDYPIDRILVVDTPQELQYRRIALRDGLSDREIAAILAAQVERQQRLAAADDILLNDSSIEMLRAQIDELHRFYLELVNSERNGEETAPPGG